MDRNEWFFSEPVSSACCRAFYICNYSHDQIKDMKTSRKTSPDNFLFLDSVENLARIFTPDGSVYHLFCCNKFIDEKCSIYKNRPKTCIDYGFTKGRGCAYKCCSTEPFCNGAREPLSSDNQVFSGPEDQSKEIECPTQM